MAAIANFFLWPSSPHGNLPRSPSHFSLRTTTSWRGHWTAYGARWQRLYPLCQRTRNPRCHAAPALLALAKATSPTGVFSSDCRS